MPVEETKEQLQIYGMFRSCIYIFLIVELVMNLPITSDSRVTGFVLALIARFQVFNSVLSCKVIELICIFVTCVGTKAKKSLKFNLKTMVLYPIIAGFTFIILCIVVQQGTWGGILYGLPTNNQQSAVCPYVHHRYDARPSGR